MSETGDMYIFLYIVAKSLILFMQQTTDTNHAWADQQHDDCTTQCQCKSLDAFSL